MFPPPGQRATTPFDFFMRFIDDQIPYNSDLNRTGHPRDFLAASNSDLQSAFLRENDFESTSTIESTQTYLVNF